MREQGRWIAFTLIGIGMVLASSSLAWAEDGPVRPSVQAPLATPQGPLASPQAPRLTIPAGLPRYDLDARLDLENRRVLVRERVRFTNRSDVATSELVFHVYPRFRVKDQDKA